ncbi:ficolin-1-like [Toxorhynchites rutilus septentrionalis]|uniref:ficolin-1-like n=1 Tax=Toxorhynchites rutilus septentrionalis TaxID=329112 RepID=UPI00247B1AFA|nr:ficolin-1-like [Toxorhynchites rutilus septentrionalis]
MCSSNKVGLAMAILCAVQFGLCSCGEKCEFGYELLATKLEALDYAITKNAASTKLEINEMLSSIKNLTTATCGLSDVKFDDARTLSSAPKSCKDTSIKTSGPHLINPEIGFSEAFWVGCDQEYEGGGWTIIQHRFDGSVDFRRPWQEYKSGFGHLRGEFWLGLEKVHRLTYGEPHELHVVLEDFDGKRVTAKYSEFAIGSEHESFAMTKLGEYSGTAGDSLSSHKNGLFTTLDRDNDQNGGANCAQIYSGAWWHISCHASNLNGLYLRGTTDTYATGMCWNAFRGYHYSLKISKMMIRSKL